MPNFLFESFFLNFKEIHKKNYPLKITVLQGGSYLHVENCCTIQNTLQSLHLRPVRLKRPETIKARDRKNST